MWARCCKTWLFRWGLNRRGDEVITHGWQVAILFVGAACATAQDPLGDLIDAVPATPLDCAAAGNERLARAARELEAWAAEQTLGDWTSRPHVGLRRLEEVLEAKERVDRSLAHVIRLRTRFADLPDDAEHRSLVRNYLRAASRLIDLSGRMRYLLRDAVGQVAFAVQRQPEHLDSLFDLLTDRRVSIGASVMIPVLFDPPPGSKTAAYPDAVKERALRLCRMAAEADLLPALAQYCMQQRTSPHLLILAAEAIRQIGLPQDRRVGRDPQRPPPLLTAQQLHQILADCQPTAKWEARHAELLAWCERREKLGASGERFRVAGMDVALGDWLLMRNPSPYNLFTDLSPGLFTHVGVVGEEFDEQGKRWIVIVDLPERGDRIPATAIDLYLQRTVHYFFVRHRDPAVGRQMGKVASSLVGNASQFDLTFRTDRVPDLRGKLDKKTRVHTYCAGFLLLCAQETTAPRSEFFPIREMHAGGCCPTNLAKLGLAMGRDFVSPTGAIFSPHLELVARCEPMYSPAREIKERIYDHFAKCMISKQLTPSPDAYQALREKLAGLSKYNPWLAQALARANGVSEHLDLEAAAKAAAVIETLDEIADASRDGFLQARRALLSSRSDPQRKPGLKVETKDPYRVYRQQHADLLRRLTGGELSPRELRIELVNHYSLLGQQQLARRFFPEE